MNLLILYKPILHKLIENVYLFTLSIHFIPPPFPSPLELSLCLTYLHHWINHTIPWIGAIGLGGGGLYIIGGQNKFNNRCSGTSQARPFLEAILTAGKLTFVKT